MSSCSLSLKLLLRSFARPLPRFRRVCRTSDISSKGMPFAKRRLLQPRHWNDAAKGLKLSTDVLMQRLRDMTAAFPDAIADTSRAVERQKLRHPNLVRLRDGLHKRSAQIT